MKTLFEHLNAIYQNQRVDYYDSLDDSDKKSFNVYMINRFISMNSNFLPVVNEIQQYWGCIKAREVYLFYSQLLPKGKQFNKYIKASNEEEYDDWVVNLVKKHYSISEKEATDYLRIYYSTHNNKADLRELLESYGSDSKKLKKAGL